MVPSSYVKKNYHCQTSNLVFTRIALFLFASCWYTMIKLCCVQWSLSYYRLKFLDILGIIRAESSKDEMAYMSCVVLILPMLFVKRKMKDYKIWFWSDQSVLKQANPKLRITVPSFMPRKAAELSFQSNWESDHLLCYIVHLAIWWKIRFPSKNPLNILSYSPLLLTHGYVTKCLAEKIKSSLGPIYYWNELCKSILVWNTVCFKPDKQKAKQVISSRTSRYKSKQDGPK